MAVVDTHCHASPYWFEPVEVLLDEMGRNGVDHAVLTQFFGVYDNSYLVECTKTKAKVGCAYGGGQATAPNPPPSTGGRASLWRLSQSLSPHKCRSHLGFSLGASPAGSR